MSFRFITKSIHAYVIDYPFAIVLLAAPFVLKLGQSEPVAMWLSVVVGVAALLLPALTDHPTGLVRIIPYWLHLWVDRAVGLVFVIAPVAFKFAGLDAVSCSRRQSLTRLRSQSRSVQDWTCAQRVRHDGSAAPAPA